MDTVKTKVIKNWGGRLTRYDDGDLDSGMVKYDTSFGYDPFSDPGNLTWLEAPTQIDAAGSVITDLIMAAKPRLESGITYVYAIGHTGRLYKIQVNQPSGYNPNLDTPVLLATLTAQSLTFKYGSSIQFYGSTEKIFIGHDRGVTKIDFAGTNETYVGTLGSYTLNVPRPSVNFQGCLYFGNGVNLVKIDSTEAVVSYGILSPAFPTGTQIRDVDVSPDGNYVQITDSRIAQPDLTTATQDTAGLSSSDSYLALWNGIDAGVTSYSQYNSYSLTTNASFGAHTYRMGYDLGGAAIYNGESKEVSMPNSLAPNFGAVFSTGNMLGFAAPETSSSVLKGGIMLYGKYDREFPGGLYRMLRFASGSPQTDVIQIPTCLIVSNLFYGSSSAGYSGNQVGSAKLYYSTLETSSAPTTAYKFYKFTTVPTGLGTAIGGVYETQTQQEFAVYQSMVTKRFKAIQLRLYTQPLVANNSFKLELIDSAGAVITGTSQTFTVGSNVTAGDQLVIYNPSMEPVHAFAVRITNLGTVNWVGNKLEVDYDSAGQ